MSQLADIERSKRQAFAAPGGSFDRLIGVLRVALPAGVGALAAILVISPVTERNEFSFLLDRNTPLWSEFSSAPAIGMHFAGDWPELKMEFWAIPEKL